MKPKSNEWIFQHYNPASDVVRCPYGRSGVRRQLDLYAKAAVNLYGIITREELVEIFNEQNADQTTVEELYILLLPLVRKEGWYGFYKDHVVHEAFFDDFDQIEYWVSIQGSKPRFVPDKEKFLEYSNEANIRNEKFTELTDWFFKTFGYSRATGALLSELREMIETEYEINEVGEAFDHHRIVFPDEVSSIEFFQLFIEASNNQRLWDNKGHTPSELSHMTLREQKNVNPSPRVTARVKIGRNDPCPCGSGKKYKKCCGLNKDSRSDQLTQDEAAEFYEIFYGLLAFVNDKKNVLRKRIRLESMEQITEQELKKVSDLLWEQPDLIDAYLTEREHSEETHEILRSWRTRFIKERFLVMEYKNDHTLFMGTLGEDEDAIDRVFAVKGLLNPVSDILRRQLPAHVETVLLPFKGKIVYDTFMTTYTIGFGKGITKMFEEMHRDALSRGIVTDLMQVDLK